MRPAEQSARLDCGQETPKDAWAKVNPLPNGDEFVNEPVELSYGASS